MTVQSACVRVGIPAVREEVHFDIRAPGPPIRPKRKLHSLQHVHYELVTHFIVPQLHLDEKQTKTNPMPCLHI